MQYLARGLWIFWIAVARSARRSHCDAERLCQHDFINVMSACEVENVPTQMLFTQSAGCIPSAGVAQLYYKAVNLDAVNITPVWHFSLMLPPWLFQLQMTVFNANTLFCARYGNNDWHDFNFFFITWGFPLVCHPNGVPLASGVELWFQLERKFSLMPSEGVIRWMNGWCSNPQCCYWLLE